MVLVTRELADMVEDMTALVRMAVCCFNGRRKPGQIAADPDTSLAVEDDGRWYVMIRAISGERLRLYRLRSGGLRAVPTNWPRALGQRTAMQRSPSLSSR